MIEDLIHERKRKLDAFYNASLNPYPSKTKRTHTIGAFIHQFSQFFRAKKKITLSGRIIGLRKQGGLLFIDIKDETGSVQCVVKKETVSDFVIFSENIDIGDFLECTGTTFKTKRGEKSVLAKSLTILAKSLRPLPSQWHGLKDSEVRLRQRYLDLLSNPELKDLFKKKEKFWEAARTFLKNEKFTEVETPIIVPISGGADAEPFKTYHNKLDEDFFLRISLEIPLKKLIIGGFENVFELGRVFRNEGIDRDHLQDFTFLEFYWAYHDYYDLMKFVEKMFKTMIKATTGKTTSLWQGTKINWDKKWSVVDYSDAFKKNNKIDPVSASRDALFQHAETLNLKPDKHLGKGRLIDLIYKKTVRPRLIQPVFLVNPPIELVPLAKRTDQSHEKAARMQIVACGTELGTGYTELNDPIDQRARFIEQQKLKTAGDKEAQPFDEDFIEAMEYGMPPMAGFGFSERLFAILMDKPVRETVIFPLMRRKKNDRY